MTFRVQCNSCGKGLQVTMAHAGKKGKCPACGEVLQIPSEEQLKAQMAKSAAASSPPPPAPISDPFADLGRSDPSPSNFGDDDFNFPEPEPAAAAPANPFASPMAYGDYSAPAPAVGALPYAGFWLRFAAWFIDFICMILLAVGVGVVLGIVLVVTGAGDHLDGPLGEVISNLFGIILWWLYYSLLESSAHQSTLGKRALGLKVTDLGGRPISFGRASGRFFGRYLSVLLLGIGFIMAAFTDRKQALHDMMAGTLVVKN